MRSPIDIDCEMIEEMIDQMHNQQLVKQASVYGVVGPEQALPAILIDEEMQNDSCHSSPSYTFGHDSAGF